jgi:drug/metabolite transporter (DMT)-like permease
MLAQDEPRDQTMSHGRTILFTGCALTAFAANSIFCRFALSSASVDPVSFTAIRLVSGAVTLLLVSSALREKASSESGNWLSALWLFSYAITFSIAYISLTAATGALILFTAVQITMFVAAIAGGERLGSAQWVGLLTALAGLIYLLLPGLAAPSPVGASLMSAAGVSWGLYSLRGRWQTDPLSATSGNFLRAVPLALVVLALAHRGADVSTRGVVLAALSGSLASGLGYTVWYEALRRLSATRAATLQLSVPVITAIGGILFLSEQMTSRLLLSSAAILGGIAVTLRKPKSGTA